MRRAGHAVATTHAGRPQRFAHTLVLIRHGESVWNSENRFTGWCDVPLTDQGEQDAVQAARLLEGNGFKFDMAFTSELSRASRTCDLIMERCAASPETPIVKRWELNERHYGALQGMRKDDPWLLEYYSESEIFEWRKSYYLRPPPIDSSNEHWRPPPAPLTESLADCQARVDQYYHDEIAPVVISGANVLIAAHANTLRALIKTVDDISNANIRGLRIPNSIPLVYHLDTASMEPVTESDEYGFQGEYLVSAVTHDKLHAYERSQRRVLMALFRALDENSDGGISLDEMEKGLEHLEGSKRKPCRTRVLLEQMHPLVKEPVGLEEFIHVAGRFWTEQDHFRMVDAKARKRQGVAWEMPMVGGGKDGQAAGADDDARQAGASLRPRRNENQHKWEEVVIEELSAAPTPFSSAA